MLRRPKTLMKYQDTELTLGIKMNITQMVLASGGIFLFSKSNQLETKCTNIASFKFLDDVYQVYVYIYVCFSNHLAIFPSQTIRDLISLVICQAKPVIC